MKNHLNVIFVIFGLVICLQGIVAQDFVIQSQFYGTEEGLSHRDVQSIHQDKQGILWLGTRYGLNRFDGYNFKWYTKETYGLQSNLVNHVKEDINGLLWLFDTDGYHVKSIRRLDIFDPITETVQSFEKFFGNEAPFSPKNVRSFAQNEKGHFVFLTLDFRLIFYNGSFSQVQVPQIDFNLFQGMHWGPDDLIWLEYSFFNKANKGANVKIQAFDLNGNEVHQFTHHDFVYIQIADFKEQNICRYFVSIDIGNELHCVSMLGKEASSIEGMAEDSIFMLGPLRNSCNSQWSFFKENDGLSYIYDSKSQSVNIYGQNGSDKFKAVAHLKTPYVTDMFFSTSGQIWVSSQFGLYRFTVKRNKFTKYLYSDDTLPGKKFATRNLTTDNNGYLWATVEDNSDIWKVNLESQKMTTVNTMRKSPDQLKITNTSVTLIKDKVGQLWCQSGSNMHQFDPVSLKFETYYQGYYKNEFGGIWELYEDDNGRLWYTFDKGGGVGYLDSGKPTWLPPIDTVDVPKYLYHFHKDQSGKFWLASDNGLFELDQNTGKPLARYWSKGQGQYYLPFDNIYHLHEDDDGSFWLGTGGTGLIHWNKGLPFQDSTNDVEESSTLFKQYSRVHGLNNVIYAVYEDKYHNFWLPSDNGIIRFNKNTKSINTYLEPNGITHHEFNRVSHHQAEDGTLFFGGLNGVTSFHPDQIKADSSVVQASLLITKFQQFDNEGKELQGKELELKLKNQIILQPDDRFFRLEFALLTFEETDKILYAFKIEGVDKEWTYQKENFIRFSRLPYGKHILKIKGQSADGHWSENHLEINLIVLRPFYLKTWFLIVSALSLFTLAFLFYSIRTGRLKKRAQLLEEKVANRTETIRQQAEELKSLEQLKSRFFSNVSHELRTPLSLIFGPVNKVMKSIPTDDKNFKLLQFVQKNANQLLKLVNEILDLSKLENNKIEIHEEPLLFQKYIKDQMAQFYLFPSSDNLSFELEYLADEDLHILVDKNKLEKIIHNFLSNAMKFTPVSGNVKLSVKQDESQIVLHVKDTGRGIHPDDLNHIFDRFYQSKQKDAKIEGGTGIGLSLSKELAELLGGKVWAESELGKGSSFFFSFPIKKASVIQLNNRVGNAADDSTELDFNNLDSEMVVHEEAHDQFPQKKEQNKANNRKVNILVVEDNPDLREFLSILLVEYNVHTVDHGKAALDYLNTLSNETKSTPDLIISDLMMPVMDGFELLDNIKSDDRFRHLPFVMLTAKANIQSKLQALRIGVDDYMLKPFDEEELITRIENLLYNYNERIKFKNKDNNEQDTIEEKPLMGQADLEWLENVENVFKEYLNDHRLNIEFVAHKINLSKSQFNRKIKKLSGLTPNQYLQEIRLRTAYDLLLQGVYLTIKEVCYTVGFNDNRYFSKLFRNRFGKNPSALK